MIDDLQSERCVACRVDSPMLTAEEEASLLPTIPDWTVVEVRETRRLRRTFRFAGWMEGVRFVDLVAEIADEEDHHPTITLSWGNVVVTWWTHAIGGLHRNDLIMAAKTDRLALQTNAID